MTKTRDSEKKDDDTRPQMKTLPIHKNCER